MAFSRGEGLIVVLVHIYSSSLMTEWGGGGVGVTHLFCSSWKRVEGDRMNILVFPKVTSLRKPLSSSNTCIERMPLGHTAKNQCRKFESNIPRKGIARQQSQFPHSCVCERFLYSHIRSAYSSAGKYVDRSWEYINRSHTHESGNWD